VYTNGPETATSRVSAGGRRIALNSLFDLISNASTVVEYSPDPKNYLSALKTRVLSDLSSKGKEKTKAATDFTLDETIDMFGLKFERSPTEFSQKHRWDIEKETGMKEFPTNAVYR
jgi:hypothetical protein